MHVLVLACLVAWAGASCPCAWDVDQSSLDCSNKELTSVPKECFETYPSVKKINLNGNKITELHHDVFSDGIMLEEISLNQNPLYGIHPFAFSLLPNLQSISIISDQLKVIQPRLFWNNSNLFDVTLGSAFKTLPKELFSSNLTSAMSLLLDYDSSSSVTPCKVLENFHPDSFINSSTSIFWAQSEAELGNCLGEAGLVSQCFIVTDDFMGCENVMGSITPLVTNLASAEAGYIWKTNVPNFFTFSINFESLLGIPPESLSCLPQGVDKIWDFQIYYQNSEHVELDTLYFDLADLHFFTSSVTQSVSIKADTVVLSRDIPAIDYELRIAAREIILRFPVKSRVDKNVHNPQNDPNYYIATYEIEGFSGLVVEKFRHANIEMILLDSPVETCSPPPELANVTSVSSLTQLDLTVQCAQNIVKNNYEDAEKALQMASWSEQMATSNPAGGMQQIKSRAATVISEATAYLTNNTDLDPLPVPYLSLQVYSEMVDHLSETILYFKDAMDALQDKLERQSAAMFDLSMTFEERQGDLEFVYQSSKSALSQAQNVYGSHLNHLNNLLTHADTVYGLIFDIYDMFLKAVAKYEKAAAEFQLGLESAKDNSFLKGAVHFVVNVGNCFRGEAKPSDVVSGIYEVSDYVDEIKDMQDELANSMQLVNGLMENVDSIMIALEDIDPETSEGVDWASAFPDTTPLINAAKSQIVSHEEWDTSIRGTLILLDDDDMKKVSGVNAYRAASLELAEWGKRISEKVISFSLLILQIKDEEENIKVDELAVEQASKKTQDVGNMLSTEETDEHNYLDVLTAQNQVIMKLMLDYYTRMRVDMLAMEDVIDEFCSAYMYNFFTECSPETKPRPEDSYGDIYLKLNKLQVEALDSVGSLNPPPQPFEKTFIISENISSNCSVFIEHCPVTSLQTEGTSSMFLSYWWGSTLDSVDRVRIDSLQVYLVGASPLPDSTVIIEVTDPAVFSDTFKGDTFTFTGHATKCIIMYRQPETAKSIDDATFLTDCSTHHSYENYFTRSTPQGLYTLEVVSSDTDLSTLESIQIRIQGSWMPFT